MAVLGLPTGAAEPEHALHNSVADIGVLALPPRVEAVLQTILVFLG